MPVTAQTEPLAAEAPAQTQPLPAHSSAFWTLTLGTLGVVYGDIGTSPLYALKESLSSAAAGGTLTREMIFGVVSLILWALIVIVTITISAQRMSETTPKIISRVSAPPAAAEVRDSFKA